MKRGSADAPVRIVVADDAPESRALLRIGLASVDGVEVVGAAADGDQAVHLVQDTHPDLILLDVAMPVMDGLEAAAAIRSSSPGVKIAVYSAYSHDRMAPKALAAGADVYLEKAATVDELVEQIHGLFPDRIVALRPTHEPLRVSRKPGPALTSAEQRYRMLLDALEEGVLTLDAEGRVTDANFVASVILQLPVSRMIGRPLADLGIDGTEHADPVDQAIRTQRPTSDIDYVLTRPDGTARQLLINVRPLHDAASLHMHETLVSFIDLTDQSEAERRAITAEARLRETFDAMLEGLAIFSPVRDDVGRIVDFRYDYVNDEGCRLNLMERDQLEGHLLCEVLPEHRRSGLFDEYVQVAETRRPLEKRALTFADEWGRHRRMTRAFDLRAVPSGDGFAVSWRDVTEDVRAQEALADSEARYRRILETTQEGVWTFDADDRVTYANPRAAAMLGHTVEAMVGRPLWDFVAESSVQDLKVELMAHETGESGTYAIALRCADGRPTWVLVSGSPIFAGDGHYLGGLATMTDIEGRKRADEQLARTTDLLNRTQELSRTGGWECDLETGRQEWTDEVYRIYGVDRTYDASDLRADIAAYDERSAPIIEQAFRRLVTEGEPYDLELGLNRADGRHIWVRTIGRPLAWQDGRVTRVGGNLVDISDRRLAADQLAASHAQEQARTEQLERSNRELEAFASALSHDLREPLRSTAGFAAVLEDRFGADLPEAAHEMLDYIVDGTRRMNERITAILNVARSGAGVAPPHAVDSGTAAAAAAQDTAAVLSESDATLTIDELPTVVADSVQLQRVFQNLITNAVKYRRSDVAPDIRISAEPVGDRWHFTVADNGIGVAENQRTRIFGMFVRGTSGVSEGTGMGLALCRRIVESYDGRIWVEPDPRGGSLFRFTLPGAPLPG